MISICASCKNLRCGNHAACARNKALEAQQATSKDRLQGDLALMWVVIGLTEAAFQMMMEKDELARMMVRMMPDLALELRVRIAEDVVQEGRKIALKRMVDQELAKLPTPV